MRSEGCAFLSQGPSGAEPLPAIVADRQDERPRFDESRTTPRLEYVCWIDIMGSQSTMLRSISIASNFVMKLHIEALNALSEVTDIELFPAIDGIYACSPIQARILAFVNRVFSGLAVEFISESEPLHRFMVRAGLAYGRIMKGRDAMQGSPVLASNERYCQRMLIGMPLTQAYSCEKSAAPFGLCLHESVRAFAPSGTPVLSGVHWKWWKYYNQPTDPELADLLGKALQDHLSWCADHVTTVQYGKEDIGRHRELAREYFAND